jgi:hypothetical protein
MTEFRNNGGVACFTESPRSDDMWREYASNHTGFCLKFRTDIPPFRDPHFKINKVRYGNDRNEIHPLSLLRHLPNVPLVQEMFCHKDEKWRYESEWRLLHNVGKTPYFYHPAAITDIYFGLNTSADHKREIRSIFESSTSPKRFHDARRGTIPNSIEFVEYPLTSS